MILYTENLKTPPKSVRLINKVYKVTGYKLNMKNLLHFYTLIIKYEKLRKQFHSSIHQKNSETGNKFNKESIIPAHENYRDLTNWR